GAGEHDAADVEGFGVIDHAAFLGDQRHHVANVFVGTDDQGKDHGLFNSFDVVGGREKGRIVNLLDCAVGQDDVVNDARIGGNDVHAVFAPQAFLDDFQMEQPQKAATEAEAQRDGAFRLVNESRIVQLQFAEVDFEVFVVG